MDQADAPMALSGTVCMDSVGAYFDIAVVSQLLGRLVVGIDCYLAAGVSLGSRFSTKNPVVRSPIGADGCSDFNRCHYGDV